MMYYDRRLPDPLLALALDGGPLGWLAAHVNATQPDSGLHIQFRRDRGNRKHGGIQVYAGRTCLLEIRGRSENRVEFVAANTYALLAPDLFGRAIDSIALQELTRRLKDHLAKAEAEAPRMFLDGEAVAHAGLMRRYGPGHVVGDPFIAADSEARVGFDSDPERKAFDERTRETLGLRAVEDLPKKLDAIGVWAGAKVALVELKAPGGDLVRAVTQVAAHAVVFRHLTAQPDYSLRDVLIGLMEQKQRVGLLPNGPLPDPGIDFGLVPVVAAPDTRDDWLDHWRHEIAAVNPSVSALVPSLRFWRLSAAGHILDDVTA